MGRCPTPRFLFEKINPKEETSHDGPINHYFDETCIAFYSHIPSLGIATYVGTRVWRKEIKIRNKFTGGRRYD